MSSRLNSVGVRNSSAGFSSSYVVYAVGLISFVHVLNFVDRQIINILLNDIKEDLQLSNTQLGLLTGPAFSVMYVLLGIPIAMYADRNIRSKVLSTAVATWSTMTAVCGLATGFVSLFLGRVGVAVGEAGANPVSHALIVDYVPERHRGLALAVFGVGTNVGVLAGMSIGGLAGSAFDWRTVFLALGIGGVAVAALVRLTLREPPRVERPDRSAERFQVEAFFDTAKELFRIKTYRRICVGAAFALAAAYSSQAWTPIYFIQYHDMAVAEIGLWLGFIIGVGGGVALLAAGRVADTLASNTGNLKWHALLVGYGLLLASPMFAVHFLATGRTIALLGGAVAWFFLGMWFGPAFCLLQSVVSSKSRAVASAIAISFATLIGLTFGPLIVGAAADYFEPSLGPRAVGVTLALIVTSSCVAAGAAFLSAARAADENRES